MDRPVGLHALGLHLESPFVQLYSTFHDRLIVKWNLWNGGAVAQARSLHAESCPSALKVFQDVAATASTSSRRTVRTRSTEN